MGSQVETLQLRASRASLFSRLGIWFALSVSIALGSHDIEAGSLSSSAATKPASDWWAFQPVLPQRIPTVVQRDWVRTPVDSFILSRLERKGLSPSPRAAKAVLLRRLHYDLTGLPPSPEELQAFLADVSPNAWERRVEQLLASPAYGERWGRHWMDLVRYADTAGDNADYPVPEAYLYRNYIIDAFNHDKPYDQFIREQLAGDILARDAAANQYAEQVIATGFLALSRRYATAPFELMHLTLEDAIDTTGKAFLGLGFRCARCHDHKFDPTTQRDYYALYGIFASTRFPYAGSEEFQSKNLARTGFIPLLPPGEAARPLEENRLRLETLRNELARLDREYAVPGKTNSPARLQLEQRLTALRIELKRRERSGAMPGLPVAYAVAEGTSGDQPIQKRGEPDALGEIVPRCVPAFLQDAHAPSIPKGSSGRRELADWIARPENPLTARVMVNRIWQHHFGKGLIATPSNLGLQGEVPSHRELLDYLARYFVEHGWSIKAMHRLILTSSTWQQSSPGMRDSNPDESRAMEVDPSNRLLWSFDRQRLDAESIRDTFLLLGGSLDLRTPEGHPFPPVDEWHWTQHNPFKQAMDSSHRSVYLMRQRLQRHPFLALFDAPDANLSTEQRPVSTVPQQALFLMNNPWVRSQGERLAQRILAQSGDDAGRIRFLWESVCGRSPSSGEVDQGIRYLRAHQEQGERIGGTSRVTRQAAWTSYAQTVMTSNEAFYVD